uniref:Sulfotransferase n=1 Tax=Phallusia mammillata TaxID=59560 RepID=A0A6F9D957_9ASCI|nr:carbohydrate sulfotransferase 1 [Phallusia mammillata]
MVLCRRRLASVQRKWFVLIFLCGTVLVVISFSRNNNFGTAITNSVHLRDEGAPLKTVTLAVLKVTNISKVEDGPPVKLQRAKVEVHNRIPPGYSVRVVPDIVQQDGSLKTERVIFPNVFRNDTSAMKKYVTYLQTHEEQLPPQSKAIIIVTNYRSGSSFFGELLNQHPDVFYMFEPLIVVSQMEYCGRNRELQKKILKDLFQCKIPNWYEIYSELPRRPRMTKNIFTCIRKKFCFAPFTKELTEEKHCPLAQINITRRHDPWDHCGAINTNLAGNDCKRKKYVAMKVIRLCDMGDLEDVIDSIPIDLKVLHLIRDPRGIAHSRHAIHPRMNMVESMRFTCKRQAGNSLLGLNIAPEWLKGRYKMFRYEDAALRPYEVAQELYDYVGLDFPDVVREWIAKNTNQPIPTSMRSTSPSDEEIPANDINAQRMLRLKPRRDPWGHSRDSKQVVQRWRYRLPFLQTRVIESVCTEIMRIAGYLPIDKVTYGNLSRHFFLNKIPQF